MKEWIIYAKMKDISCGSCFCLCITPLYELLNADVSAYISDVIKYLSIALQDIGAASA
ncbi:hypothetical protein D3C80_2082770 [compost metagenome]